MGADCKSVAKASQVRILYLPPQGQSVFLAAPRSREALTARMLQLDRIGGQYYRSSVSGFLSSAPATEPDRFAIAGGRPGSE